MDEFSCYTLSDKSLGYIFILISSFQFLLETKLLFYSFSNVSRFDQLYEFCLFHHPFLFRIPSESNSYQQWFRSMFHNSLSNSDSDNVISTSTTTSTPTSINSMLPPSIVNITIDIHENDRSNTQLQQNKETELLNETCCICLEKFGEQTIDSNVKEIVQLSCQHIIHKDCIQKWIQFKEQCPLCRSIV